MTRNKIDKNKPDDAAEILSIMFDIYEKRFHTYYK
jgi:hypothetical protein